MNIAGDENAPWVSFEAPDDGDDEDAESVDVGLECLANRTAYLKALRHPATAVDHWLEYTEPTEDWIVNTDAGGGAPGGWIHPTSGGVTGDLLSFPLSVPNGVTIKRIDAFVDPRTHASIPAVRPLFRLWRWAPGITGNGGALIVSATDTSLTAPDYELPHSFGVNVNHVVTKATHIYRVFFFSEAGAGSETNTYLMGIRVRYDMTHLDPRSA